MNAQLTIYIYSKLSSFEHIGVKSLDEKSAQVRYKYLLIEGHIKLAIYVKLRTLGALSIPHAQN